MTGIASVDARNGDPCAVTLGQAQAVLEEARKRKEACDREIAEALKRHNCKLDAAILLRDGQVSAAVNVVPVD
jgi:acetone carboxylase gamma subunit